jgi:type I restriction enzyme, R subunit
MAKDYGFADYLLFVDGKAVGALEAKKEGVPLIGIEGQAKKYLLPSIFQKRCGRRH